MTFELPARQGRSKRPVPAVSIGARRRGKAKKLTPYVMFTAEAAQALFGSDSGGVLQLAVGAEDHAGWIKLTSPAQLGVGGDSSAGNVSLRLASKMNDDLVVESVLIPHDGKTSLRRCEAEIAVEDGGLLVRLPWAKKKKEIALEGHMRGRRQL